MGPDTRRIEATQGFVDRWVAGRRPGRPEAKTGLGTEALVYQPDQEQDRYAESGLEAETARRRVSRPESAHRALFEQCVALGLSDRMLEEAEVRTARTEPPANTRAGTRGMIIQRVAGKNVEVLIDNWENLSVVAGTQGRTATHPFDRHRRMIKRLTIKLEDPLMPQDASVIQEVETFAQSWNLKPETDGGDT